ncbi:MAG: hypothetical protein HOC74_31650 [Gemmatimonadetes bacterium]|nr:hypothetical protein [Gemmatimonadota bacterium]
MEILFDFTGKDEIDLPTGLRIIEDGFPDGASCGELTGPLVLENIARPWKGRSLQLTLFRPQERTFVGGVVADDVVSLASSERQYGDCIDMRRRLMLPPGITHLIFDIDPMRTTQGNRDFDFSQIRSFSLNLGGSPESPVYVRHLRLCDERDAVGEPAGPAPGDTVTFLQHQDIACYTYELERAEQPEDIRELEGELDEEMRRLERGIRLAQLGGKQTLYAEAGQLVAGIGREARALYPWTRHPAQRRRDLGDSLEIVRRHFRELDLYARGVFHEDDEDDSNIPVPVVPGLPNLATLKIAENALVDENGHPVLLYAMNYHSDGPLCRFFAPDDHRVESYAVGGGSRYDIEWSPVYRAFHQAADGHRVGFRGWCGHLIKDQWAMGGRKENVVICLESEEIRLAVSQYNREHQHEWRHNPHLVYNILAYELMYMCYCEKSVHMFRQWLREKHGEIDALNRAWGTEIESFGRVDPPQAPNGIPPADTSRGLWFDWTFWNARRFIDILVWAKEDIRQIDPRIPLCAGGTFSMVSAGNGNSGIDEELIIAEVDDVILHEGGDLLTLDLLRALVDRPKPVVDPEHGGSAYQMLQGFLHGKSTISKFWWPKQPSRQFPHMTLEAPMQGTVPLAEVEEHLRVALDVRRLRREIALFWDLPAEVAIHYSRTCMLQVPFELLGGRTTPFLQTLRLGYDTLRRLDAPVTFASERQILAREMDRFSILVLPAVRYMPREVFARLDGYLRGGGTLVLLPEGLLADEYARPQEYLVQWGIRVVAAHVPQIEGLGPAEQGYDQSFSQTVHFGEGKEMRATEVDDRLFAEPGDVETAGIFQEIDVQGGEVLAVAGESVLLVRKEIGNGALYYFAGMPTRGTQRAFMDILMEQTGVYRPFRVSAPDGSRLAEVEARLVHTKFFDLLYLVNEGEMPVDFRVETERPFAKVRELRSLAYWEKLEGMLPGRQTLIFKLMMDPVEIGRAGEETAYPYFGM